MTALAALVVALESVAVVVASLRWLRVAQREHYLPGAASRFAWRWWTKDGADVIAALLSLAAAVGAAVSVGVGMLAALIGVVAPFGLPIRGTTSPLHWTRRLRELAAVVAVLDAGALALAGALGHLRAAVVAGSLAVVLAPLLVDLALKLTEPLEERLAHAYVARARRRLAQVGPLVVGITGSYGKTSTKHYLAHLLSGHRQVLASPRSFNNRAGLSRTVNDLLAPGTEVLVAEMGAYGAGEIAALCDWLQPAISVITAIGPVHLERFKSLERTLAAKAEITASAHTVVLNVDDVRLAALAFELESTKKVIACSATKPDADVALTAAEGAVEVYVGGRLAGRVELDPEIVTTNAACALAVALELGVPIAVLLERLRSLPIAEHRLVLSRAASGVLVLDDTFNANPPGAARALEALARHATAGKQAIVVSPGMVELGPVQYSENRAFALQAAKVATAFVVVKQTNRKALLAGLADGEDPARPLRVVQARSRGEALEWVQRHCEYGDVVLYENDLPDHYP